MKKFGAVCNENNKKSVDKENEFIQITQSYVVDNALSNVVGQFEFNSDLNLYKLNDKQITIDALKTHCASIEYELVTLNTIKEQSQLSWIFVTGFLLTFLIKIGYHNKYGGIFGGMHSFAVLIMLYNTYGCTIRCMDTAPTI